MQHKEAEEHFIKGLKAISEGKTPAALSHFEKALETDKSPLNHSYFGLCIAKERGQVKKAVAICEDTVKNEPGNSTLYLNLARVYLIAGRKEDAIRTFREGMHREADPEIIAELNRLGMRRPPVFSFLRRKNPLNRYLGFILKKLGYR